MYLHFEVPIKEKEHVLPSDKAGTVGDGVLPALSEMGSY